jgi:hypothetical protein
MELLICLVSFWAIAVSAVGDGSSSTLAIVYVEGIGSASSNIIPLAEIQFDPSNLNAELLSYEAPYPPQMSLFRIGVYDTTGQSWLSSTTVTSVESFSKGHTPTIILFLDTRGNVIGATCKSGRVDAAHTRDFGPKVKVVRVKKGKRPELNKLVIVSKEGKLEVEPQEKTFIQKYVTTALVESLSPSNYSQVLVGGPWRYIVALSYKWQRQIEHFSRLIRLIA